MISLIAALLTVAPPSKITVSIDTPRSTKGIVRCALFSNATGFPGKSPLEGRNVVAATVSGKTTCEFENVPAGSWAISILHDENQNWVLDTGLFGIPTEGYGASNNVLPALSPPTFDDSRFTLKEGEQRALSIRLKY